MQRLIRKPAEGDDRGATAVLTAMLITALVGGVGLAVDMGAVYAKRQELQNGADAAAFAVAQEYAASASGCQEDYDLAGELGRANVNITDVNVVVEEVDCSGNSVRVDLSVPQDHWFIKVIPGAPQSSQVNASATVSWGVPQAGATLPLALSTCDFQAQLGEKEEGDFVTLLLTKDASTYGEVECSWAAAWPTSENLFPAGFGFIGENNTTCYPEIDLSDPWVPSQNGNNPPNECGDSDFPDAVFTAMVPLFDDCKYIDDKAKTNPNTACRFEAGPKNGGDWYHIEKFAYFEIHGYFLSGNMKFQDGLCEGGKKPCIYGKFIRYAGLDEVDEIGPPTGDDAALVIRLTD